MNIYLYSAFKETPSNPSTVLLAAMTCTIFKSGNQVAKGITKHFDSADTVRNDRFANESLFCFNFSRIVRGQDVLDSYREQVYNP